MDSGEDLEITSSNSIEADLTSFCNVTKNILVGLSNNADKSEFTYVLKKR